MSRTLLSFICLMLAVNAWSQPGGRGGKTNAFVQTNTAGSAYGVVVGISQYQHLPPLRFADRDARVFADYLLRVAHVPPAHLEVLIDKQATLVNFTDALTQVRKDVRPGDRVYLYFAGHGDIETRTDSTDNAMLMLVGAARKDYNATFDKCHLRDLKRWLDELAAAGAEVIFVADACRSGAFVLAGGALGQSRTLLGMEQEWAGQVKLLACEPGELAIEGQEFGGGRGLFSYCLVDGLMGLADGAGDNERDGTITKAELEAYLKAVVRKTARPHVQNPQVLGGEAELPLGTFNADSLQRYQQHKSRAFTLLTATQTKGLDTDLLQGRDSTTRRLYGLFEQAVEARRLLHPANQSALHYLRQLPPKGNTKLLGLMKRNLVAALQQRTDNLLQPMLTVIRDDDVLTPVAQFDSAMAELDASIGLLEQDHNLLSNLKARRLFLEGNRLLKTERRLANTNDSLSLLALTRFRQSARLEPNMAYTYWKLAETSFVLLQVDSAMAYLEKCRELLPNSVVVLYKLSEHYAVRHQLEKARKMLEMALRIDPTDVDINRKLAELYYQAKKSDQGKLYVQKALASIDKQFTRPDQQAQRLYEKGCVLGETGQLDKAIACLRESIRIDSTNGDALLTLGRFYNKQQNWAAAIRTFERILRKYPEFSVAYSALADAYLKEYDQTHEPGLLQKAQVCVDESLIRNPGNILALFAQSIILFNRERYIDALPYIQKAILGNPSIAEAHFMLGGVLAMKGDTVAARLSLQRADSLGYQSAHAKQLWGFLSEMRKDFPSAERYYRQGLALDSTSTDIMAGLARSMLNQEKRAELALPIYQRLQRLQPGNETYWLSPGYIYIYQKKYDEALTMFREATRVSPQKGYNQMLVGQTYLFLKQYQPAAESFEKAFRLDSTNADYAIRAARIYNDNLNQPDRLFALARRVVLLDSAVFVRAQSKERQRRFVDAVVMLYLAARQPAQHEEAIYWQKRILAVWPNNGYASEYCYQIGNSYVVLNRFAEAATYLRDAIRYKPTEVKYRNLLATALIRDNKPAEAEVEARRAIRLDSSNLSVNFNLAVAVLRQGRYAEAWQAIQHVARIAPADSWEAPYLSARWYARQGNATEALAHLETALTRGLGNIDPTGFQTNSDFDPIRQIEGYIRLMHQYFPLLKK
ncbi:tetratricopeptide repeat protein [Fibrella sp. WM1]|uniref:tetratricopeptide repeat protein n=1 Tax=Fibrella musci TaxID=3242485 RepID=UPI003522A939